MNLITSKLEDRINLDLYRGLEDYLSTEQCFAILGFGPPENIWNFTSDTQDETD